MMDLFIGTSWAQAGAGPGAAPQIIQMVLMMTLFIGIYYFIVLRPQNQQQQKHGQMLATLKKGDSVITTAGMHGKIAEVEEQTLILEVARGTKVRWEKARIARVVGQAAEVPDVDKK